MQLYAEKFEEHKEPETMRELYSLLFNIGEQWRKDNEYIVNEGKKNERVEIPHPSVATVASLLKKHCHFTFIGYGQISDISKLYFYHLDFGYYIASDDTLRKLVIKFDSRLTSNKFYNEVIAYLRTETYIKPPMQEYYYIPVKNGVFNILTKQLEPFSPKFIITSKITTAYNEFSQKPILSGWFDFDKWLDTLSCNDSEVITLLWQIMNEAINPNRTRKKMVFLTGDGNNGKGTFQSLLENLIGKENISNLKPDHFTKEFYTSSLEGKTCNIGDDISNKYLDEVSDLMSIVSGDRIQVNRKGRDTFEATYRLLCIFSGNDLPRARNKTNGWYRRLCIVPFNADFNGKKERPEIKDKFIKDKSLLEWVLFRILTMPDFDKFIEPKVVTKMLNEYKRDNDYILTYVTEFYIPHEWHEVNHVPMFIIKNSLKEFLDDMGADKANTANFGRQIIKELEKLTANQYEAKTGRTRSEHFHIIDPIGHQSNRIKGSLWGVSKKM